MNRSETGDEESVVEALTGFDLLANLNIPSQPLVYCPIAQGLVKVTDRQEAVGLCLNQDTDSGLYMTADELYACTNHIRNVDYHLGFFVATPSQRVYNKYGLEKRLQAQPPYQDEFLYCRNFEIKAAGFTYFHKELGYLHDSEIARVSAIDEQIEEEESKIASATPGPSTPGKLSTANKTLFSSPTSPSLTTLVTGDGNAQVQVQHKIQDKVKLKHLETLSAESITAHRNWKRTDTDNLHSIEQIVIPVRTTIDDLLFGREFVAQSRQYQWYQWDFDAFYDKLLQCFKPARKDVVNTTKRDFKARAAHDPCRDTSIQGYLSLSSILDNILKEHGVRDTHGCFIENSLSATEQEELGHYLYQLMLVDDVQANDVTTVTPRRNFKELLFRKFLSENPLLDKFPSIEVFMQYLLVMYNQRLAAVDEAANFGMLGGEFPDAISQEEIEDRRFQNKNPTKLKQPKRSHTETLNVVVQQDHQPCNGCGWKNTCLDYARCHFRKHPGYNTEKHKSWADSTNGKSYKTAKCEDQKGKVAGRDQISFWHLPDGTKLSETAIADLKSGGMTRPKRLTNTSNNSQGGENKVHQLPFSTLATYVTTQNKSYLRPFTILCRQEMAGEGKRTTSKRNKGNNSKDIAVKALIDTGAIQSSYISLTLAHKLHKLGLIHKHTNKRICSGINNTSCTTATDSYDLELTFVNEKTNLEELLVINAQVIDCRFDLIIGQPDIFAFDLTDKFPSLFSKSWTERHASRKLQASEQPIMRDGDGAVCPACTCEHAAANPKVSEPPVEKLLVSKDALLDPIDPDDDMIDDQGCPWDSEPSRTSEDINRVPDENLHGSPEFKRKLRAILDAYEEVFRATLTKEPAKVPLFELKVDTAKWLANAAGKAPRQMSKEKMKETERQIQSMLSLELIRESHASAVSHVMLAPKPGGKWRFCVDYRTLNLFSETTKWPIPNIKMMLERIGNKRAKFFGILDLSQGFYQVPLSEHSKALTAFITWCGTYEWNRLPMGIKGAPPFFQQIMATIVLASLIYVICELYIDDILLHAQTEDEFCANLTTILDRCRQYNIKLNPKKCCLGMSEVEYVGHTVNETGMHFKRSKLDSVLNFELPTYGKQLKSFIGFCNYFRDHVENFSAKMFPLNALLKDYDKRRRLVWTDATRQAFEDMKMAIHECPALFFMDDDLPVYLHTDASKYGIGAYLFQLTPDGKEKPIAFISKTLNDAQRRWHTPQKEAYAIYYACSLTKKTRLEIYILYLYCVTTGKG